LEKILESGNTSHVHGLPKLYCENGYSTESNLQMQCNFYQNSYAVFQRDRRINAKIYMKSQKTSDSQSNPEQKDQCWSNHYLASE
jgi:hypothetical protein